MELGWYTMRKSFGFTLSEMDVGTDDPENMILMMYKFTAVSTSMHSRHAHAGAT